MHRKFSFCFETEMVFVADWWAGTTYYFYCEEDVRKNYLGKEHSFLLMNHKYDIDWLMGWVLSESYGMLGNCKAYAKKVIQYVPSIGWCWKFAEFVFLERSFEKDKGIIEKQINEIFDYPDPVWVCIPSSSVLFCFYYLELRWLLYIVKWLTINHSNT